MADNVTLPGTGAVVASDEVGGAQYQIIKLALGADGVAALVALGQALMAASIPVVLASNQSAVPVSGPLTDTELRAADVKVSLDSESVAVTGPLTDIELRATDVKVTLDSESVAVTGPLTDTQLRASAVPVSGGLTDVELRAADVKVTLDSESVAVTGPLTDAQLRAADVKITLDNESVAVTGPLTNTELRATAVPVSAASLPLPSGAATEASLALILPLTHAQLADISTTDFTPTATTRQIRVGGLAGDVKVDTSGSETIVIPAMQQGESLPLRVTKIYKTGTTATNIIVFW